MFALQGLCPDHATNGCTKSEKLLKHASVEGALKDTGTLKFVAPKPPQRQGHP